MPDQLPIELGHTVKVVTKFCGLEPGEELKVIAVNHAMVGDAFLNVRKSNGKYVVIPEKNVALIPPEKIIPGTPFSHHVET